MVAKHTVFVRADRMPESFMEQIYMPMNVRAVPVKSS